MKTLNNNAPILLINEILYDPEGSDLGYEWIELYNTLEIPLELANWKIQVAGTTFKDAVLLSSITVQPKSYLLICEQNVPSCDYYIPKLGLQNGGGSTDGIQLLDSKETVIDTLLYDSPNTNNLTNEIGAIVDDDSCAKPTNSNESLGRKNHIDTDINSDDFYVFQSPTPGRENPLGETLSPTGANVIYFQTVFLLFILLIYSARLMKRNINYCLKKNGH